LGNLKCTKREILEPLLVLLAPFAPHITEELWSLCSKESSVHIASWPKHDERYLVESSFNYPVSINGKTRTNMEFALDANRADMEKEILANETVQKWMDGKSPKKVIIVPGRIVNVVI